MATKVTMLTFDLDHTLAGAPDTHHELTADAAVDIIKRAAQFIEAGRVGNVMAVAMWLDGLESALVYHDVLPGGEDDETGKEG